MSPEHNAIRHLLMSLGATPNYTGFRYTVHALLLSLEQDERLTHVSKYLYPDIASHYHTTYMAVERDIRTLIAVMWKRNPQLMHELAGHELKQKPTVSQFLSILTVHLSTPDL